MSNVKRGLRGVAWRSQIYVNNFGQGIAGLLAMCRCRNEQEVQR
ncbi:MAG: hypothetical protein WAM97_11330 [Acidimicrobiales bacterium]